ncbi:hypothetical protein EIN_281690 [Entamoeba invadens IP1]|uniref:Uncharacterized protein n=1 Tax=Entamoeba invadens IP1 TaxID=370355 RepID=A0A0A1TX13_ENTIV|nr:hypothetical protein EIN_281690 [Entamoeba invadens IP1]ELP85798.1 hypothetical protein EIN_281690 [Entamoeba invadens IP1]|eukprot:XP_004185144.1 hypothetical protein EIN_281690 [Entamoeba invadens IP1]
MNVLGTPELRLSATQTLIEYSLSPLHQKEAFELMAALEKYQDFPAILLRLCPTQRDDIHMSITLMILKKEMDALCPLDPVEVTKYLLTLLPACQPQTQKCANTLLTHCFMASPLTSQMIIQFVFQALQNVQINAFIPLNLFCLVITDHFEELNSSYYNFIQQILQIVLTNFCNYNCNVKALVISVFTQLLVFEAPFLSNVLNTLFVTFCDNIPDDVEYRMSVCTFCTMLPSMNTKYGSAIPDINNVLKITDVFFHDVHDKVFVEAHEIVLAYVEFYPEQVVQFLINEMPLLYKRCLLTDALIRVEEENEAQRKKDGVLLQDDEVDNSVRGCTFAMFDVINSTFGDDVILPFIQSWVAVFRNEYQVSHDWKCLELLLKFLADSSVYLDTERFLKAMPELAVLPVQNLNSEIPLIKVSCLEYIGYNPLIVSSNSKEIVNQIYQYLLRNIGDTNYTVSCTALHTLAKLADSNVFEEHNDELLKMFVPMVRRAKGQVLFNVCELITNVISLDRDQYIKYQDDIQKELAQAIYENMGSEDLVDMCLTTIFSNVMLFERTTNELSSVLIKLSFDTISNYLGTDDIINQSLRLLSRLYQQNTDFVSNFINTNKDTFFKLFELCLPNDNGKVIEDSFGFLGDIVEKCSQFVLEHKEYFMQVSMKKLKTFKDRTICSVVWYLVMVETFLPHIIKSVLPDILSALIQTLQSKTIDEDVQKNVLLFSAKAISIDPNSVLPFFQLLTNNTFKSVLQIKRKLFVFETLVNFAGVIIKYPDLFLVNKEVLLVVYKTASSAFPELSEVCQKVLSSLSK